MELIPVLTPTHCFSREEILFKYAATPWYNDNDQNRYYATFILLKAKTADPVTWDDYDEVLSKNMYPDETGLLQTDVSAIVDAYLKYFIPPVRLDQAVKSPEQSGLFTIFVLLRDVGVSYSGWDSIDTQQANLRVFKGGFSYYSKKIVQDFISASNAENKLPLFYNVDDELVDIGTIFYLFMIAPLTEGATALALHATVTYWLDGAQATFTHQFDDISFPDDISVMCFPAGYTQLGLHSLIPSGAEPISYSLKVLGKFSPTEYFNATAPVTFTIDHRKFYNYKQLLYRNSLGGLQPVRMLGQIDFENQYESSTCIRIKPTEWMSNLNVVAQSSKEFIEETASFTGNTGWVSKEEIERLRDMFLSPEVFEVRNNMLIPVIIKTDKTKFYSNQDTLFNAEISWQEAFVNAAWAPEPSQSLTCPAMLNLTWRQTGKNKITFFWALPAGYDYMKIVITWAFDMSTETFWIEGNAGSKEIEFTRPVWATTNAYLLVTGRVVCNRYNEVPDLGAAMVLDAEVIVPELPVVAQDDYYEIPKGYPTPLVLKNALLNDYDPEGGEVEAVVATSQPTAEGGTFSINALGEPSYLPPSTSWTGMDSFTYYARRVGGSITTAAAYYVKVV